MCLWLIHLNLLQLGFPKIGLWVDLTATQMALIGHSVDRDAVSFDPNEKDQLASTKPGRKDSLFQVVLSIRGEMTLFSLFFLCQACALFAASLYCSFDLLVRKRIQVFVHTSTVPLSFKGEMSFSFSHRQYGVPFL